MPKLRFEKWHGIGNDFVMLDCLASEPHDLPALARRLCDRRLGIGADQMLLVLPSKRADFRMRILNADGGEVEMCGNGIRCFYRYLRSHGLTDKERVRVETAGGIMTPAADGDLVTVDMGEPILEAEKIGVNLSGRVIRHPIEARGKSFKITCVSMGNPHCVVFVEGVAGYPVERFGPVLENHPLFPNRTNVEFVEPAGRERLRLRTWERGAGETLACGTGACAAAVASVLEGCSERTVAVSLRGGDLRIRWEEKSNHVFMTGPTKEVYKGEIEI